MNKVFIVIGGTRGCADDVILGLYPTVKLAQARIKAVQEDYDFVGYDVAEVGAEGGDCEVGTR